jgi:hypothetical protein
MFDNISLGKPAYDPNTQRIWSELEGTLAGGTKFRGVTMWELTQEGVTSFSFYATADEYANLKPVFLQTALSVTPDPEIAYRMEAVVTEHKIDAATWIFLLMFLCWPVPAIIAASRNHPKKVPI